MFSNLFGQDSIIILLIILVLFGSKKLPELARGMGQAIREFQKAKNEFDSELHSAGNVDVAVGPKQDIRQPQATVARIENLPAAKENLPDPATVPASTGAAANDI